MPFAPICLITKASLATGRHRSALCTRTCPPCQANHSKRQRNSTSTRQVWKTTTGIISSLPLLTPVAWVPVDPQGALSTVGTFLVVSLAPALVHTICLAARSPAQATTGNSALFTKPAHPPATRLAFAFPLPSNPSTGQATSHSCHHTSTPSPTSTTPAQQRVRVLPHIVSLKLSHLSSAIRPDPSTTYPYLSYGSLTSPCWST